MKKTLLLLALTIISLSCSSDDGNSEDIPQFAMTAKINGNTFQANNPFGDNSFSSTNIYSTYPIEDFVLLQARQGGVLGNPEINLWLKRDQIAIGTYNFSTDDSNLTSHVIDLIDLATDDSESTIGGTITITEVNQSTKIVRGTFEFTASFNIGATPPVADYTVTNGTFRYRYENVN